MTLPPSVFAKVAGPMRCLGFELTQAERQEPHAGLLTTVTIARNGTTELVLVHIPKVLLDSVTPGSLMMLTFLEQVLNSGDRVAIFSEGLAWPRKPYVLLVEQWPARSKIVAFWVSWPDVEELESKEGAARDISLRGILELKDSTNGEDAAAPPAPGSHGPGPPASVRWSELEPEEQSLLLRVVGSGAENSFTEQKQYFDSLVDRLEVQDDWRLMVYGNWGGQQIPGNARKVLMWSFARGRYPLNSPRKEDTVAGALLELLTEDALDDDTVEVGRLIVRRSLIGDDKRLESLKRKLGLDTAGIEGGP